MKRTRIETDESKQSNEPNKQKHKDESNKQQKQHDESKHIEQQKYMLQTLHTTIDSKVEQLIMYEMRRVNVSKLHKKCKNAIAGGKTDHSTMAKEFNFTIQLRNIDGEMETIKSELKSLTDQYKKITHSVW